MTSKRRSLLSLHFVYVFTIHFIYINCMSIVFPNVFLLAIFKTVKDALSWLPLENRT